MHVGDSIEEDVAGAHAAGLRAVLLDRDGRAGAGVPAGVEAIAGLDELLRLARRVGRHGVRVRSHSLGRPAAGTA